MKLLTSRFLLIILFLSIFSFTIIGQVASNTDSLKLVRINPLVTNLSESGISDIQSQALRQEQLTGCICDPVFPRIIGISILGGSQVPNFGIGMTANPLFWKHLVGELHYRRDPNNNYFINSYLRTKNLLLRFPIDFIFEYDKYEVTKQGFDQYDKISLGIDYHKSWTSFGLFVGNDNYQGTENYGFSLSFLYNLHKATGKCCPKIISLGNLSTTIGLWNDYFNYKIGYYYLFNIPISLGLEYERLYNFKDFQITLKYWIFY